MATKAIKCPCGWSVNADDEEDLIRQAQEHAKEVHDLNPSREEILALAQPE
jgi:predicted small metal-binding protein